MLFTIPFCLAALVVPLAVANPIDIMRAVYPRDKKVDHAKVMSYQRKDCKGKGAPYIMDGNPDAFTARNVCFKNLEGKSFNRLEGLDGVCDATVTAFASSDCSGVGLPVLGAPPGKISSCENADLGTVKIVKSALSI